MELRYIFAIVLAGLMFTLFLSSCDVNDPRSFKRDSKIEVEPFDLTTTSSSESSLDFYDSWEELEFAIFESKVVDNRDIIND